MIRKHPRNVAYKERSGFYLADYGPPQYEDVDDCLLIDEDDVDWV
jgi:hypothetical protein